jgi:hypothetical protein
LQVKTTTNIFAPAKDASDQVFPSTPGKEKSGAADPIGKVGCSSPGRSDLSTGRTQPEKHTKLIAIKKNFIHQILSGYQICPLRPIFPPGMKLHQEIEQVDLCRDVQLFPQPVAADLHSTDGDIFELRDLFA